MLLSPRMGVGRQRLSPVLPALALTAAALFFGGGAGGGSLPWLGGAAVVLVAVLAATRGFAGRALGLLPLVLLTVWCAASVAWSIEPDRSWEYANRTLVYVAFALLGTYLAGRTGELALGLAGLLGAVAAWSLAGKALPWLADDYGRVVRLRAPVGYWNALALLGAVALPLGLWLAGRWRSLGALLVYGWLVAIALTLSRGGAIVAVLVVAAWIALSGAWVAATTTLVAAGVPAAAVAAIAFSLPGVTSDGESHATRLHDGALFGLALLAGALAAAALARLPRPDPTPALRGATVALVAVAAVVVIAVGTVHARSWWGQFTSPASVELSNSPGRFVEGGSNHRWVWWKQAWRGFEEHPLKGTGAGSFHFTNLRYRKSSLDSATEPHNLPLQFLSETGAVGFGLFAAASLTLVLLARRRSDAELALALALPAYLVHGLLDIGWDFAAISAPVMLVAGALAVSELPPRRRFSAAAALAGAGVALAALMSLFAVWLADRWAGEARSALARPAHAITLAKRSRSLNPLAVDPLLTQALAEQELGRLTRARGLLQKATEVQPESADAWYSLAAFDLALGCPRHALPEYERFYELNPQDPAAAEKDKALRLVNSGTPRC